MRKTRKDDEFFPYFPECVAIHLVRYLFDVGPVMSSDAGKGPVNYQEINAWQQATGIPLNTWEAKMLRQLSLEYLSESHLAKNSSRPSPFVRELEIDREDVAKRVRSLLRG